ncbi:Isy1-like splicing factor [Cokeromyces recurvatus]|uniref:Isy1-like splicing factor n=1 Tax=Cokeromyces recurvatus TaxID=90255 RepID=UPI00221F516E|nr:Isy1-like splicing factor [Cokeromyces recurvatus]KAI7899263.1 Isy1-like splicing factor [Cokeromyces recurvatus]
MARNEEKAQSMLYRFREAQAAELGLGKVRLRRPAFAGSVSTVQEAERWRRDILSEISRKISKIQDVSLSDYQVRDLNDDINKLMGQKYAWEMRIKELGGADYTRSAPKMINFEGREVPGTRGYKYFGRARDLPGVRELFEKAAADVTPAKAKIEINRDLDAEYYGYDDEQTILLEYEQALEKELIEKLHDAPDTTYVEEKGPKQDQNEEYHDKKEQESNAATDNNNVPSQKEIETYLVERRKQQLLDKYVSEDLKQSEEETKQLTDVKLNG